MCLAIATTDEKDSRQMMLLYNKARKEGVVTNYQ